VDRRQLLQSAGISGRLSVGSEVLWTDSFPSSSILSVGISNGYRVCSEVLLDGLDAFVEHRSYAKDRPGHRIEVRTISTKPEP
jgi:hypothetical protein